MSIVTGSQTPPAGMEHFSNFMEIAAILADPGRLAAEYDKLEHAKAAAQSVIDLVGPAQNVLDLRDAATQDRFAAQQELDGAKIASADLMAQARDQATQIVASAQEHAEQLTTDAQMLYKKAVATSAKADADAHQIEVDRQNLMNVATATQTKLDAQLDAARVAEQAANAKQVVLDERIASMSALAQHIVSTVALTE